MITIDQLLESVDLDFEPRWVTKSDDNWVIIWGEKPFMGEDEWYHVICRNLDCGYIKLSEFDGKDWTDCIYEVPRKVNYGKLVGKLCRFYDKPTDRKIYGLLAYMANGVFAVCGTTRTYSYCEPVRPDDDVIYKGE